MNPSDFLGRLGRTVAFYPGLVKHLGSVNATVFFCQLFYWSAKCSSDFGVYKTATEFTAETGLTVDEQRTARAHLRKCGVLLETEKRLEHRIYYRLDLERFDALVGSTPEEQMPQNPTGEVDSSQPRNGNIPFGSEELPIRPLADSRFVKEQEITKRLQAENAPVAEDAGTTPESSEPTEAASGNAKRAGKPVELFDPLAISLPEYIDLEAWSEWAEMRRVVKKKSLTKYSAKGALAELEKFVSDGHDANKLLRRSTGREWLSFVPNETTKADEPEPPTMEFVEQTPEEFWGGDLRVN